MSAVSEIHLDRDGRIWVVDPHGSDASKVAYQLWRRWTTGPRKLDFWICMNDSNNVFPDDPTRIQKPWDSDFVGRLIRSQNEAWRQNNKFESREKTSKKAPKTGLRIGIMIEVDHSIVHSKTFKKLASRYSNHHISLFVTCRKANVLVGTHTDGFTRIVSTSAMNREPETIYNLLFKPVLPRFVDFVSVKQAVCTKVHHLGLVPGLDRDTLGWIKPKEIPIQEEDNQEPHHPEKRASTEPASPPPMRFKRKDWTSEFTTTVKTGNKFLVLRCTNMYLPGVKLVVQCPILNRGSITVQCHETISGGIEQSGSGGIIDGVMVNQDTSNPPEKWTDEKIQDEIDSYRRLTWSSYTDLTIDGSYTFRSNARMIMPTTRIRLVNDTKLVLTDGTIMIVYSIDHPENVECHPGSHLVVLESTGGGGGGGSK